MIRVIRQKVDGAPERQFLTAAITSDSFVRQAMSFYDPDLLSAKYVRIVAEWCFNYFQKYEKAPGLHIQGIFDAHADRMEPADRELIADLLAGLSNEYERTDKINVQYMLDQSEKHFKARSLSRLAGTINGLLSEGETDEAEQALAEYKRVGRPETLGANPFKSVDTVQRAFEQAGTPLFTLPGALGRMLNRELNRDMFLGIMGAEKRGKSWYLNELALRAAKTRCNVALFQVGDMSQEQVVVRLGVRLSGKSNHECYCGEQLIPIPDCMNNQMGQCPRGKMKNRAVMNKRVITDVKGAFESGEFKHHLPCTECVGERFWKGSVWYKKIVIPKPLSWRDAWQAGNRFLGRIKGRDFMLSVHPSHQLSVAGIKGMLDNWETFEGFVPDVIVIDYADNLVAENTREEFRHQQNRIWQDLRGLSQERHCLVITATQAAGRSYKKASLEMEDYSEDKRKYAHVTAMIGLNQSTEEKKVGLMRINMIVQREGEFFSDAEVTVAQSLRTGRPLLFSF